MAAEHVTSGSGEPAASRLALTRCIAIDPAKFAADYWARAPLLTTSAELGRDFTDLLTLADVDEIVSRRGLRTPFIRVAKDGNVVDAKRYTRGGGVGAEIGDQVADDRLLELFADGATIVLQGLHRLWPPLIEFAAALTADLGHPVQINAYVTPPQSQGFSAHYDVHDVFVLQAAGAKAWRIHPPVIDAPLRDQPWTDRRADVQARAAEQPLIDAVLHPGDALYLPRGFLHSAQALGGVSVHLTVGVHPLTRYALVESLLALAADDPQLRVSLPLGIDVGDAAALAPHVAETVERLVERLQQVSSPELVSRLVGRALPASRPSPLSPIAQAGAIGALQPGSVLRWRPYLRYAVERTADGITLRLADRRVSLPAGTAAAIEALRGGQPLAVRALPGLDSDDALVLARRLLREGILVPVE